MFVNGCDCSIVIKTAHIEKDIPYSDETLREAVSILKEEVSIEGGGVCGGLRKSRGVTGCVVTPLTAGTAPLLLYLAMGSAGMPLFVSETRNLYQYRLDLLLMEDTERFDVIQDRRGIRNERIFYEGCRVQRFELRIMRGEAVRLRLDICGECPPSVYSGADVFERESGERFSGDRVTCGINGREYTNIYGITLLCKKKNGTRTEVWVKRAIENGGDIPAIIDDLTVTAQLLRDTYECRFYGMFRITARRLVLTSDETNVNSADAVMGMLRYYAAGGVSAEVFTSTGEAIP